VRLSRKVRRDAVGEIGQAPQAVLTACEPPSREISRRETGLRICLPDLCDSLTRKRQRSLSACLALRHLAAKVAHVGISFVLDVPVAA
jgi:hypothetical protein